MTEVVEEPRTWRAAWRLFLYTWANIFIISYSIRALAEDDFLGVFVTDMIYGVLGFTLFKQMQQSETKLEMFGYTVGVALGSQTAMHIYKLYVLT
jgi:hypothetical protein